MTLETLTKTDLWAAFENQARAEQKKPAEILAELLREYLETSADVKLNESMRRDAHKSGLKESEAVRLVREHRANRRKQRDAA
ncbi:MAG TPA: hypothetical protein VF648_01485 [Pyrinomonadaceae bacterium]|jgi:hypothetical protein